MRFTSRDIVRYAAIVGTLIAAFSFTGCGGDGAVPAVVASGDDTSNADVLLADVADAQTDADVLVDTVSDVSGEVGADANEIADDASDSGATDAVAADAADTADVPVAPSTCKSDKDCSAAGKVCDPLTLVCVACLSDAECGPSQHCVGLICQTYTACNNSLGCKTAKGPDGLDQPICDQKSSECTACLTAADCPASNDCIAKACVPFKTCQNSTDCGTTQVCDKASNRCVDCLGNADCQANELCEAGTCRPFVACASDKQCTPLGLLCDTAKGKCAQCLQNTDCPEIYNCQKVAVAQTGKCVLDVCAQGQGACANNAMVTCDLVGDGYGSAQACPAQTTCVAPGSKPECKAWVCTPGTNCNGEKVVTCSDDGLTIVSSTDCAAGGQKCSGGTCKALVCAPSATFCDGQTVKNCAADGLSSKISKTCLNNEFCAGGACQAQICKPAASVCDGQQPGTCNADGSAIAPSGLACDVSSTVCIAGSCVPKICQPALKFCESGSLKTCSPDGTSVVGSQACGVGNFCGPNKVGDPACQPIVCAPGKPTCDGTSATTCNADGSGFTGLPVDCTATGKACSAGVCVSLLCDPQNPLYCDGKVVKKCDATGMNPSILQTCGVGFYCGSGACSQQICTPNSTATCAANKPATCNADGSGYVDIGSDCTPGTCSSGTCVMQVCGNGVREGTEECDDGNKVDGDACSSTCSVDCSTLTLNGSGKEYVDIGSGANYQFGTGDFTLEAMIRPTSTATGYILNRRVGDTYLGLTLNTGNVYFQCEPAGSTNTFIGSAIQAGVWTHVAATRSSGVVTLWVNGQAAATGTTTNFQQNFDVAAPFRLGTHPLAADTIPDWSFTGDIAFVAIDSGAKYTGSFTPSLATAATCKGDCTLLNLSGTAKMVDTGSVGAALSVIGGAQLSPSTGAPPWGPGKCAAVVCSANVASCLGNLAGQCNADSTGLASATDCAKSGKTCSAGGCVTAFASCHAALVANATATDGVYPIDPDGAGPIAPANLFCDMKNGGLTLVANIYDSNGDDAPNDTSYVVSGWQQTASGAWTTSVSKVDRDASGTGSAAVSLTFVAALKASGGQQNLKMCYVSNGGVDTVCRLSSDSSLTLASYGTGNPQLVTYAADPLTYTFGRIAGLPATTNKYAGFQNDVYCIPVKASSPAGGIFGTGAGLCENSDIGSKGGVWHAFYQGGAYLPYMVGHTDETKSELLSVDPGFRLYVGP